MSKAKTTKPKTTKPKATKPKTTKPKTSILVECEPKQDVAMWGSKPQPIAWWQRAIVSSWIAWTKFKQCLPRLVWYGQEINVMLSFTKDKYLLGGGASVVRPQFAPDLFSKATTALRATGVEFDSGYDTRGRHWFLDHSLAGPIRVKFVGVTERRHLFNRQE